MKWIELKMSELGLSSNPAFTLSFYVCSRAMLSVMAKRRPSEDFETLCDVKPLPVLWALLEGRYGPSNTIHVDDISRNFLLNPAQGLKIPPFKNAHQTRASDRVLWALGRYLINLVEVHGEDFSGVSHRGWEKRVAKLEGDV